jgi:hypothetical protein
MTQIAPSKRNLTPCSWSNILGGTTVTMKKNPKQSTVLRVKAQKSDGTDLDVVLQSAPGNIDGTQNPGTLAVGGDGSTVSAGDSGVAIAGFGGHASVVGADGLAYVPGSTGSTASAITARGIAINGGGGAASGTLLAYAQESGNAKVLSQGIAIALNRGDDESLSAIAQAEENGLLIFGYFENGIVKYVPVHVDESMGGKPYKLDKNYKPVPVLPPVHP